MSEITIEHEETAIVAQPSGQLPVAQSQTTALLNIIAAASSNPDVDVNKLTELLNLQERVLAREAETEFNAAFAELAAEIPRVQKNGTVKLGEGPQAKSYKFATWEDMDEVLRPRLRRHGFVLTFDAAQRDGQGGGAVITATLLHSKGHSRSASIPLPLDSGPGRNNLQAMGSTLQYGKRYATDLLLNVVRTDEDDDAVRGGMQFISAEQVGEMEDLARDTGTDLSKFLIAQKAGARRAADVQEKDFERLKTALFVKKAQKLKGQPVTDDDAPVDNEGRLDAAELAMDAPKPSEPVSPYANIGPRLRAACEAYDNCQTLAEFEALSDQHRDGMRKLETTNPSNWKIATEAQTRAFKRMQNGE